MKLVSSLGILGYSIFHIVLFGASPAIAANQYEKIGHPVIRSFNSQQIGGINQNWALTQDNNGLIYNATGVGISVWDGTSWHFTRTPNRSLVRSMRFWKDNALYAGTIDDIGFYAPNSIGELVFTSLIDDWADEDKQFGEVWSVATTEEWVAFATDRSIILWNGEKLFQKPRIEQGRLKLFTINNQLLFKRNKDTTIHELRISEGQIEMFPTKWILPEGSELTSLLHDKQKKLVAVTVSHGIFMQINENTLDKIQASSVLSQTRVFATLHASDGYFYLTTLDDGIFIFNDAFEPLRQYTKQHGLGGNRFYSVMEDSQGNLWFAGVPNVIKMFPPHKHSRYTTQSVLANRLKLFQGKLTKAGYGIFQMQPSNDDLSPSSFQPIISNSRLLWDFVEYNDHLVYAGRAGVVALPIMPDGALGEPKTLIDEIGKVLLTDKKNGLLYASTMNGLHVISYPNRQFKVTKVDATLPAIIYMTMDESGVLWGGTASQELYKIEHAAELPIHFKVSKFGEKEGIGPNNVVPYLTSQGLIIGTNDGFLNYQEGEPPQLKFNKAYPLIFNTPNIDVFKLYEDKFRRLWYRTGMYTGFVDFSTLPPFKKDETIFKPLEDKGYKGFYSVEKDILWFISANGEINRINIAMASSTSPPAKLNIRSVRDVNTGNTLFGGMGPDKIAALEQQQNSVRISFSLADSNNQNPTQYRHRLLGSRNQNWSRWTSSNQKDFTQLPGADYTFEVEAKDAYGQTSQTQLKFSVLAPWYLTSWAWGAYFCLLIVLVVTSAWASQKWRTRVLTKRNKALEDLVQIRTKKVIQQAKQLELQQAQKDQFFANVSHEFRTPITLIQAPLQDVLNFNNTLEAPVKKAIESAIRNSKKLLELIGQILDFQKLDSAEARIQVAPYKLNQLAEEVIEHFEPWAKQQQQNIHFSCNIENTTIYFDWKLLETCLANLVSNALKYSRGNEIHMVLEKLDDDALTLAVSDNGIGINDEDKAHIFDRFFQGTQSQQLGQPGTGIGLSIVKEIMKLHKGSVFLSDNKPTGCCFTLILKQGKAHFDPHELLDESISKSVKNKQQLASESAYHSTSIVQFPESNLSNDDQIEHDETTLLIIDDNPELLEFLKLSFTLNYHVVTANNGQDGLNKAQSLLPDLIISDVMMPVMNGLEMLARLRTAEDTQTIPVILLTAKSTKRETVEGILSGADDYLTKPFDTSELIVRVKSIINSRKAIREKVRQEFQIENTEKESFEAKMIRIVRMEMNDPNFGPEALAKEMAMSQRNLLRHCKQAFSLSIVKFIAFQRMEVANSLLQSSQYAVAQTAYACGFESVSYFSKAFRKHFGHAPSVKK